jgi:membrane-associated phospholipid phosphatase
MSGPGLAVCFAIVLPLSLGPLLAVDRGLNQPWRETWPAVEPVMQVVVRLGQRAVCLPVLILVAAYYARRTRSWQPLLVSAASVLVLNLVVGICKILTARDDPLSGDPDFFEQGVLFPSGHAANAVLVYGLAAHLARHYDGTRSRAARLLTGLCWFVCVAMLVTGLYFRWHWFTDLVAGYLVGGVVLRATIYWQRRFTAGRGRS